MTIPADAMVNVAGDTANVGIQAHVVHGDVFLYQPAARSPDEKYRAGVRYLDGGMPTKARQLIGEAMTGGFRTNEVCFHWMLALLSGRTRRQFSVEDSLSLSAARAQLPADADDEWARGLSVISQLLDSLDNPDADIHVVLRQVDGLGVLQQAKIYRHLEMFLSGPVEDQIWKRAISQVRRERLGGDRENRAWMFFESRPAPPRVRRPDPPMVTLADRLVVIAAAALGAATCGYIGWLLVERGRILALIAALASIAAGYVCFGYSLEWRYRVERLHAKEAEQAARARRSGSAPDEGFAASLDRLFGRYFARYVPDGTDRNVWLEATAGIRQQLRDEIAEVYRESRITSEQIAWLVRHRVGDVKRRWQRGTLWAYRDQWRTPASTKTFALLSLAVLVSGASWAVAVAARTDPAGAVAGTALLAGSGCAAARSTRRIMLEPRRYQDELAECQQRMTDSEAAFARWQRILARKPDDTEMATWLDCDRRVLLDRAMRHYRLAPSDVIAHAFIDAPAKSSRKARILNGPWRYTRYRLLVFLLTADGVRQVTADLDFRKGVFNDCERINYRFDAIAAVHVTEPGDNRRTFELTLVNGQPIVVPVTESNLELQEEDAEALSSAALDATGLTTALHVLEGVAAEGKGWIREEGQRQGNEAWMPAALR
ncbi:MAG TPA: hypothetical protein VH637_24180 [Streptosporangiaceae bacterium]|jgi:hypothetical protein